MREKHDKVAATGDCIDDSQDIVFLPLRSRQVCHRSQVSMYGPPSCMGSASNAGSHQGASSLKGHASSSSLCIDTEQRHDTLRANFILAAHWTMRWRRPQEDHLLRPHRYVHFWSTCTKLHVQGIAQAGVNTQPLQMFSHAGFGVISILTFRLSSTTIVTYTPTCVIRPG